MNTVVFLQNGNTIVFEEVFHEYNEKLYFYFCGKTKSDYLAREIVQLTFIKLWRYRTGLSLEIPLSKQIFRIAKTTMIDVLRKHSVVSNLKRNYILQSPADSSLSNETMDKIDEGDLKAVIHSAVKVMPSVRRQVFEMSRFNGMSNKEIASELSVSTKTVENHITQAIKHLRNTIPLSIIVLLFQR